RSKRDWSSDVCSSDLADKSIRKVLALAADRAVHIVDDALAGSDMVQTARVLAEATKDADLILAGAESTDGRGAMVPAMIAEILRSEERRVGKGRRAWW